MADWFRAWLREEAKTWAVASLCIVVLFWIG